MTFLSVSTVVLRPFSVRIRSVWVAQSYVIACMWGTREQTHPLGLLIRWPGLRFASPIHDDNVRVEANDGGPVAAGRHSIPWWSRRLKNP